MPVSLITDKPYDILAFLDKAEISYTKEVGNLLSLWNSCRKRGLPFSFPLDCDDHLISNMLTAYLGYLNKWKEEFLKVGHKTDSNGPPPTPMSQ